MWPQVWIWTTLVERCSVQIEQLLLGAWGAMGWMPVMKNSGRLRRAGVVVGAGKRVGGAESRLGGEEFVFELEDIFVVDCGGFGVFGL